MKKFLAILLASMMLLVCLGSCGNKADEDKEEVTLAGVGSETVYKGFAYETNEEGDYTITGYRLETTSESTLSIPTTINDRPVTAIGDGAFKAVLARSIAIPEGIVTIGKTAFYDCDNLVGLKLPSTVTSIGEAAFADCAKLTNLSLPAELTEIPNYMAKDCVSLTSIAVPAKVTSIGAGAFMGCITLKSVSLPTGLTTIGDSAFVGCAALKNITLPKSLTTIGQYIFSKEVGTKLTVPADSKILTYAQENEYQYVIK